MKENEGFGQTTREKLYLASNIYWKEIYDFFAESEGNLYLYGISMLKESTTKLDSTVYLFRPFLNSYKFSSNTSNSLYSIRSWHLLGSLEEYFSG